MKFISFNLIVCVSKYAEGSLSMKRASILLQEFTKQMHNDRLKEIYVDDSLILDQSMRYQRAVEKYINIFDDGEAEIYSTPGRSEVGGNHTDHQQGMVLAASVNLDAIAVAGYNEDGRIYILSEGYEKITVDLSELEEDEKDVGTAIALVKGVAAGFIKNGYKVSGFQAYITSDVLGGSGLSSSAAFEVIIGTMISGLFNQMSVHPSKIAEIAQFAENVYFKKPCGLMDQMACSVGGLIHIDFKDKKEAVVNQVNVDFKTFHHSLCIVDTKGSHDDLTDEYASIPYEMKQVAEYFHKNALREVDENTFYMEIPALRKKLSDRPVLRAIHFFEEEHRVECMVKSLLDGEFNGFLELIQKSGDSSFKYLQNIYTNKEVQNQSMSIALAVSEKVLSGNGASRVHGGGFAGTIQAFVSDDFVSEYKKAMDGVFGEGSCRVLKVRALGGIKVM